MESLQLPDCSALITRALDEDFAYGPDHTTMATVAADATCTAELNARQDGVIAGLGLIEPVLSATAQRLASLGISLADAPADDSRANAHSPQAFRLTLECRDGTEVAAGQRLATITANTRLVLAAERTLLNIISHASGIATETRRWVRAIEHAAAHKATHHTVIPQADVRDTRKTLPGMRELQKYAVRAGGGSNHRMGLGDAAMIKDNHVHAAGGSVSQALRLVREHAPHVPCEVEVDTLEQLDDILPLHPDIVLLDNFTPAEVHAAVARRQELSPATKLEASGGLSLDQAGDYGTTGVDYIAVGALTHSVRVLDIGLDFS